MPRKLTADMMFDTIEEEILFTTAALAADPDAQDLAAATDGWLALLDAARAAERDARRAVVNTDARRAVANGRLDEACAAFGDDLYRAVDKDRTSARFTQFFPAPVNRFVRQALSKQVQTVQAWLGSSKDPVVEQHRAELHAWSSAAQQALLDTRATALARGTARQAREHLAEELTRGRDGLHDALGARGRERKRPRSWPDAFFRAETRPTSAAEPEPPAPAA